MPDANERFDCYLWNHDNPQGFLHRNITKDEERQLCLYKGWFDSPAGLAKARPTPWPQRPAGSAPFTTPEGIPLEEHTPGTGISAETPEPEPEHDAGLHRAFLSEEDALRNAFGADSVAALLEEIAWSRTDPRQGKDRLAKLAADLGCEGADGEQTMGELRELIEARLARLTGIPAATPDTEGA